MGAVKSERHRMTHEERMARDRRMAAAIAACISNEAFRERFGSGAVDEIPRIREEFKIKNRPTYRRSRPL